MDPGRFRRRRFASEEGPDVAVGARQRPALWPDSRDRRTHSQNDLLLPDVWGKLKTAGRSVYCTTSWIGYLGKKVAKQARKVFRAVKGARDKAVDLICSSFAAGKPLQGGQVDKAARTVIEKAGYGKYFFHRTGHNIEETIHGNGANMDGLESHDVRHLIPRTCTSIEPGIYLPEFGIRSELNVYIDERSARAPAQFRKKSWHCWLNATPRLKLLFDKLSGAISTRAAFSGTRQSNAALNYANSVTLDTKIA